MDGEYPQNKMECPASKIGRIEVYYKLHNRVQGKSGV